MSIRRDELSFEGRYATIPNDWLRDIRLSRKARGLLAELMSHRPGWRVTLDTLVATGPEGREAIRTGIAELERAGYLRRSRERAEDGRLGGMDYVLVDPGSERPTSGNPTEGSRTPKKTREQEDQITETENGAAPASWNQREYLRDLHQHGGGAITPGFLDWLDALTVAEADAEIREALAGLPRGREYRGDPESPDLSEKGRETARRKMIPGGRDEAPHAAGPHD